MLMPNKVAVYRKEHFNAAHRLHSLELSDEANAALYGKCNNPNYHGHNYELIVKVVGIPDSQTGYVIDTKILSEIIQHNIIEKFDHRNLNEDCAEFKLLNPTVENIAIITYNILRNKIDNQLDLQIRLYETERNFVDYPASINF